MPDSPMIWVVAGAGARSWSGLDLSLWRKQELILSPSAATGTPPNGSFLARKLRTQRCCGSVIRDWREKWRCRSDRGYTIGLSCALVGDEEECRLIDRTAKRDAELILP
jgi:hypothetical protein